MFIETLEFTIPVDLCDLFSSMKRGPQSNLEFPASVNSYGTTQDANIQVVLKSNKLTFKVDGVSSNSSMISKSECKTLKLSVFDVDCSPPESDSFTERSVHPSTNFINPAKRPNDRPSPSSRPPPTKASRPSYSNSPPKSQDIPSTASLKVETEQINIKQEPDLIEIEPDPDPYEESSAHSDHMQMSQAALDRLSHPRSSNSSSSSFHQNVPHVQDYSEPGPSHRGEDYVVYQDTGDNDYDDNNDSNPDFGNDGEFICEECGKSYRLKTSYNQHVKRYHRDPALYCRYCKKKFYSKYDLNRHEVIHSGVKAFRCDFCGAQFYTVSSMKIHIKRIHFTSFDYYCKQCGKGFNDRCLLWEHENNHSSFTEEIGSGDITLSESGEITPGGSGEVILSGSGDITFGDPEDLTPVESREVIPDFKKEDSDD